MGSFPCNRYGFLVCLACGLAVFAGLVSIARLSGDPDLVTGSVCEGLDGGPGDLDGDGFVAAGDCDDADPGLWSPPGTVVNLTVDRTEPQSPVSTLAWSLDASQSGVGSAQVTFTTLRSGNAANFADASVDCLGPAETGLSTEDLDVPEPGQAFFYLVRPDNACGTGSLGTDSAGQLRAGRTCDCAVICDDGDACTLDSCSDGVCTNIVAAPEIVSPPSSTATCDGEQARFSVVAQGSGQLSYEWRQNGQLVGGDSPELLLASVRGSDNGAAVTVDVFDSCAGSTSTAATLTVFPDPLTCQGGSDGYEAVSAAGEGSYPYADVPLRARHKGGDGGAVYVSSGEYYLEQTDLEIPGRGFDFVWNRKYRSRVVLESALGPQWDFGYNRFVEPDPVTPGNLVVHDGNTRADSYGPGTGQGCFEHPGHFRELCVEADGLTYTLTFANKQRWIFNPLDGTATSGKIAQSVDRNGNTMTFAYDTSGRLETITDTLGRPISLGYDIRNQVVSVTDFAGRQVLYDYYDGVEVGGSLGDLKSVTTPAVRDTPTGNDYPAGKTTTYTYSTGFVDARLNHNLRTVTDPKGQTFLTNVYTSTTLQASGRFDRLDHQVYPDGIVSYAYVRRVPAQGDPVVSETFVVDRAGNVSTHAYDDQNRLVRLREHTGRAPDPTLPSSDALNRPANPLRATDPTFFEHVFEYNADSLPTRIVRPGGDEWSMVYDSANPSVRLRGNLLQRTHDPGPLGGDQNLISEQFTYATDFGSSYGRRVEGAADSGSTWRAVGKRGLRVEANGLDESNDELYGLQPFSVGEESHAEMLELARNNSMSTGLETAAGPSPDGLSYGIVAAHRHESIGVRSVLGRDNSIGVLTRFRNESIGLEAALGRDNSYGLAHINRHNSVARRGNSAEDLGLIAMAFGRARSDGRTNSVAQLGVMGLHDDSSASEELYGIRGRTDSRVYLGGLSRNSSIGLIEGIRFKDAYGRRLRRGRHLGDNDDSDDFGSGPLRAIAGIGEDDNDDPIYELGIHEDDMDDPIYDLGIGEDDDDYDEHIGMQLPARKALLRSQSAPAWGRSFPSTYQNGRGQTVSMTHDDLGNLRSVEEPRAITGTPGGIPQTLRHLLDYDAFGQLVEYRSPEGRIDRFVYCDNGPQRGYLCEIVLDQPSEARTTLLEYDTVGNIVRVTDPRGNATQLVVNERDQVVRMVRSAPFLHEVDYYYDANDLLVRVDIQNVDDQGNPGENPYLSSTRVYDALDRTVRAEVEVDSGGACVIAELEYDANENETLFRDGEATSGNQPTNTVRMLYDERDLPLLLRHAEGDPAQSTTEYDYDSNGNLAQIRAGVEDPADVRVTTMEYDGYNRLVRVVDAVGNEATQHYDGAGNRVAVRIDGELDQGSGLPPVRLYEDVRVYDEADRLVQKDILHFYPDSQEPIGDGVATTRIEYDADSRVVRVEDDNGHDLQITRDTLRHVSELQDAVGNRIQLEFDGNQHVSSLTRTDVSTTGAPDQVFVTTIDRDELNRVTVHTDNRSQQWRWSYDSRGNLTATTDPLGNTTRYDYDGMSRPVRTERTMTDTGEGTGLPVGSIVLTTEYDDSSRVSATTDANGNRTRYTYDALDRLSSITTADGVTHTFTWTPTGAPDTVTDGRGTVATISIDPLGRVTGRTVTPSAGVGGTTQEQFVYDGMSNLRSATNDDTTVTLTYDSLQRSFQESLRIGTDPTETTTVQRDGVGNPLAVTYPSGRLVTTVVRRAQPTDERVEQRKPAGDLRLRRSRPRRAGRLPDRHPGPVHLRRPGACDAHGTPERHRSGDRRRLRLGPARQPDVAHRPAPGWAPAGVRLRLGLPAGRVPAHGAGTADEHDRVRAGRRRQPGPRHGRAGRGRLPPRLDAAGTGRRSGQPVHEHSAGEIEPTTRTAMR